MKIRMDFKKDIFKGVGKNSKPDSNMHVVKELEKTAGINSGKNSDRKYDIGPIKTLDVKSIPIAEQDRLAMEAERKAREWAEKKATGNLTPEEKRAIENEKKFRAKLREVGFDALVKMNYNPEEDD